MVGVSPSRPLSLVGRTEEQRWLRHVIERATSGQPAVVLVHGEPGSGKTSLVRAAAAAAREEGFTVLWGTCIRLSAEETPYLPLVNALEGWMQGATPALRDRALTSVEGLGDLLPMWRAAGAGPGARLLPVLAELLRWIASLTPTLLVVDDLHWSDPASRDALAFLVAGLQSDRIVVLTSYRDSDAGIGHALQGFVADLRRMPGVLELGLPPLDLDSTRVQVEQLLGRSPKERLVAQVANRSAGNPYFTELLVQGLFHSNAALPDELPDELSDELPDQLVAAVLAAWHRMSLPARRLAAVLAVAGRPVDGRDLVRVYDQVATDGTAQTDALAEAIQHGIMTVHGGEVWFRHPLIAESVLTTLLPGEAAPLHERWAVVLAARSATGVAEVHRQADLARHYEGMGAYDDALEAALSAAAEAQHAQAAREAARHLREAARLWAHSSRSSQAAHDLPALLERAALTSRMVGDAGEALAVWEQALAIVDPGAEPLRAARLIIDWADVAWDMGQLQSQPTEHALRAVELSRAHPDSPEHAQALACLSECLAWSMRPDYALAYAQRAVSAAERSGSPAALSAALMARGGATLGTARADSDTRAALTCARESGSAELVAWAHLALSNHLGQQGRHAEVVQLEREAFADATMAGASSAVVFQGACLAQDLVDSGQWDEARQVLQQALGPPAEANSRAKARLAAVRLAVRRGELDAADQHLARAYELIAGLESRPGLEAPPVLAEHLLAHGEPEAALRLLTRTLPHQAVDRRVLDRMVTWAATAAADVADAARDRRDRVAVRAARTDLNGLLEARSRLLGTPFAPAGAEDTEQPARGAVFEAELARCERSDDRVDRWRSAEILCAAADLVWEQHVAGWRLAEALLEVEKDVAAAATPLRAAHTFAKQVGALPLLHAVEDLARVSRIRLDTPRVPQPRSSTDAGPLGALTPREREVLAHLVAGRTYAEIARELFISEKTVGTHVSNLLHKTDTTSRRDVAALALRLGFTAAER
jgi:DNA-binding CsgD family transcriptional regulator/tetratricopeptide (TPR) repeat protein